MNTFQKSKKGVALFVLIMFLCTLTPVSAFAAEPSDNDIVPMAESGGPSIEGFKYFKINSGRAYFNASTCMAKDMLNWYYAPISLNDIGVISFAIQITQPVDLKVYKASDDYCSEYNAKEDSMVLKKNVQLGGSYEDQFCAEFLGYIQGYEIRGVNSQEDMSEEDFQRLLTEIANGEKENLKDYYKNKRVQGYTEQVFEGGRSLFGLLALNEDNTTGDALEVTSSSSLAFEITEDMTTEQAMQLVALAEETEPEYTPIDFFHNQIAWDGTVVDENGENPQKLEPDQNYIIVLEPSLPAMNQYRSYVAFRTSNTPLDEVLKNAVEFEQLFQMKTGDPVDLLTGAFTWEYTDISMYGDEDLPYTRYYNSTAAEKVGRLGYGWSDNYSYQVNMEQLYAEVVFPGSQTLYFELGYDGRYKSKPGSAFTFEEGGSGYVLTHKDGTVYDFNADGNIVSITKLNGDVTSFTYNGDKLSSVSTDTGTLNFSYSGDYVSTVTDSTGRSVTFSYSDDNLISAVNPDADDLQYTYDAYHRMLTIQNFNGDVYLSNVYDDKDRVVEQYVEGEGNFYFTYDGESRVNTCTGENGYFQSIEYDVFYRIISDTTNDGTEYFTYNEKNERTSYTNRLGHTWQYGHDENGNVTSITYPNGATEFFDYDA
ncbi:MAG: RHS repeat protein, partial [Peptococcaceae bacterium]|nr:RHS repeat protein [Peptococcaceae bacterium]